MMIPPQPALITPASSITRGLTLITSNGNFAIGEATTSAGRIRLNGAMNPGNATRTVTA